MVAGLHSVLRWVLARRPRFPIGLSLLAGLLYTLPEAVLYVWLRHVGANHLVTTLSGRDVLYEFAASAFGAFVFVAFVNLIALGAAIVAIAGPRLHGDIPPGALATARKAVYLSALVQPALGLLEGTYTLQICHPMHFALPQLGIVALQCALLGAAVLRIAILAKTLSGWGRMQHAWLIGAAGCLDSWIIVSRIMAITFSVLR